jgi:glutamyl-tRNA synthetase
MFWQELEAMREEAKAKNKWGSASQAEIDAELEKGTPYTYRFRVPQEGSVTIHDLIRGEVCKLLPCIFVFVSQQQNFCLWLQCLVSKESRADFLFIKL